MALNIARAIARDDGYIPGLTDFLNSISPLLIEHDRWGFGVLHDAFDIGADAAIYLRARRPHWRRAPIRHRGQLHVEGNGNRDEFLAGVGYDFSRVVEPFKTELKAFFAWRLSSPTNRTYSWHSRTVRLIEFCARCSSDVGWPRLLVDFGHPLEQGDGNRSTRLRSVMTEWLQSSGYSIRTQRQSFLTNGKRQFDTRLYDGSNSMPANDLLFTLILLREKMKPLVQRDIVLASEVFRENELPDSRRREVYITFYKLRLPWLREACRSFILNNIEFKEFGYATATHYVSHLKVFEDCLLEKYPNPEMHHVTRELVEHTFLIWGNDQNLIGKNWYSDVVNVLSWASSYLAPKGWPSLAFDKRTVRKVEGEWSGGRGYELKVKERSVPEEVVEQLFEAAKRGQLPDLYKRLIIIARYTGMRAGDLHSLAYDCLAIDPDDDRFMLLTFFQSKVKTWNTKPLLKEDAAHALVIETIREQQVCAQNTRGAKPKYLFGERVGDAEKPLRHGSTREALSIWCRNNGIQDKAGEPFVFRWHGFRHFYGTELALLGHDIAFIQMELGHASPEMSMVYVNLRLRLKKKAVLEKGTGRFIDIKGQVDEKLVDLAVRRDAALIVDVPGGSCTMPAQIGEWCEHNRACLTCAHFRADVEQIGFFETEKRALSENVERLRAEADAFEATGRAKSAEIGRKRMERSEAALASVNCILSAIKSKGVYRGTERNHKRAGGVCGGTERAGAAEDRGDHRPNEVRRRAHHFQDRVGKSAGQSPVPLSAFQGHHRETPNTTDNGRRGGRDGGRPLSRPGGDR